MPLSNEAGKSPLGKKFPNGGEREMKPPHSSGSTRPPKISREGGCHRGADRRFQLGLGYD